MPPIKANLLEVFLMERVLLILEMEAIIQVTFLKEMLMVMVSIFIQMGQSIRDNLKDHYSMDKVHLFTLIREWGMMETLLMGFLKDKELKLIAKEIDIKGNLI